MLWGKSVLDWDKVAKPGRDISFLFCDKEIRSRYDCPYSYYPVFIREHSGSSSAMEYGGIDYKNEGQWALWKDGRSMGQVYTPDAYYLDTGYYGRRCLYNSENYCLTIFDSHHDVAPPWESRYAVPVSDEQIPDVALEHIPEWTPVFFRYGEGDVDECGWGLVRFGKLFDGEIFRASFDLGGYRFYYGPNEDPWEEEISVPEVSKSEPEDDSAGRFTISWNI